MSQNRLAIIGSNDLAQLIAHHALADDRWEVAGFFDNRKPVGTQILSFGEVLGDVDSIEACHQNGAFDRLIVGVGYTQFPYRKAVFERFKGRIPFASVIHPNAYIDRSVVLGEGVVVLPGCVADMDVRLGDNVLLNTGVRIAHHTTVAAHSFLAPAVSIAGKTSVGECCFIGTGATLADNVTIAPQTLIGAGAGVLKDLTDSGTYVGFPARRIKQNIFFPAEA